MGKDEDFQLLKERARRFEESDETQYWLEVLQLSGAIADLDFREVYQEASELTAIFTASEKTARRHKDRG